MILAIDPGNIESAYCLIEKETYKPIEFGKIDNDRLIDKINSFENIDRLVIEMVASYGMPVGKEVFDTCVWIGRFVEEFINYVNPQYTYIYRKDVKMNLCNSMRAKDSNIRQTFIDNPYNLPQVNHIDGDKSNNGIDNLEWCDASYNMKHAYEMELNNLKKYNISHSKKIIRSDGKKYNNSYDASRELGVSVNSIRDVLKGRIKTCKGFKFSYEQRME